MCYKGQRSVAESASDKKSISAGLTWNEVMVEVVVAQMLKGHLGHVQISGGNSIIKDIKAGKRKPEV